MIELERHIEILLLNNDCVIVPDFGGFMAHHVNACYYDTDMMFIPPKRTLGFNPQLKMNDSLLALSYIEAYDISYPEAVKRIESETLELKQNLYTNGVYDLNDIGTLFLNEDGNIEFKPCDAGILTPELYGLGGFEVEKITKEKDIAKPVITEVKAIDEIEREAIATPVTSEEEEDDVEDDNQHGITIPMSVIRYAVAAVAAVVLFFVLTSPVANSETKGMSLSSIKNGALFNLFDQPSVVKTSEPINVKVIKPVYKAIKKADTTMTAKKTVETTDGDKEELNNNQPKQYYCLVLASKVSKGNAEIFVKKMRNAGYCDTKVYVHHKTVRVVYGCYSSEGEAYNKLNKLRDKSDEFKDSWVYKVKG